VKRKSRGGQRRMGGSLPKNGGNRSVSTKIAQEVELKKPGEEKANQYKATGGEEKNTSKRALITQRLFHVKMASWGSG